MADHPVEPESPLRPDPLSAESQAAKRRGLDRNPHLFVLFRIFFSCRFYYPVFAILFLDFGLSIEQFAYLNLAWAVTIVLLEVPSGALADQFGRRPLVIAASILMIIEMLILCLSPVVTDTGGDPAAREQAVFFLFLVFLFNRVVSGAAEAAASGADEALAYDSLEPGKRELRWSQITTQLMRWQALSFIVVTLVGAAVYDPDFVNWLASFMGMSLEFSQQQTLKFPIYLNLGMALATLATGLRMTETHSPQASDRAPLTTTIKESFQRIYATGVQILHHPATLMLILIGLFFDSAIRLYYTVGSVYLKLLQYEPRHFGLVSVAGSATGIAAAWFAGRLMRRFQPTTNFRIVASLIFIGLLSLAFPIPKFSVIFLVPLWLAMRFLHFFISNYLNRITASENRATILSFRSMTMNLAFGAAIFAYGLQTQFLRTQLEGPDFDQNLESLEQEVFARTISSWWIYFTIALAGLYLFRKLRYRASLTELVTAEKTKITELHMEPNPRRSQF